MKFKFWIESAEFSDGTTLEFLPSEIIVIVGPNNGGKTTALRNIEAVISSNEFRGITIKIGKVKKEGSLEDFKSWIDETFVKVKNIKDPTKFDYKTLGSSLTETSFQTIWDHFEQIRKEIKNFLCFSLGSEQRLQAVNPAEISDVRRDQFSNPTQVLYRDDDKEKLISSLFYQAFGLEIAINRGLGRICSIYCGIKPEPKEGEDRISLAYIERLEQQMDELKNQGDGMKAFVGVLLYTIIFPFPVTLIDEPDLFLHPPQARLLGKMLSNQKPEYGQLFLATHSGEFLRGLLDAQQKNIRIIRIQKENRGEETINLVRELPPEDIQTVWKDPLLRHSNVLDGLFHEKVVVCEADADCRFYKAVLDTIYDEKPESALPDVMFIHCGGKDRIPLIVNSLKKLGVPVLVISDFDIFNDKNKLKEIIECLGGNWESIESDWKSIVATVGKVKPNYGLESLKEEIDKILDETEDGCSLPTVRGKIKKILKDTTSWGKVKSEGKTCTDDDGKLVFDNLSLKKILEAVNSVGLFVVEIGELESFCKSVGNHGPKWVNKVLEDKNLLEDPELEEARVFVNKVIDFSPDKVTQDSSETTDASTSSGQALQSGQN